MTSPLWQKAEEELKSLLMKVKEESESLIIWWYLFRNVKYAKHAVSWLRTKSVSSPPSCLPQIWGWRSCWPSWTSSRISPWMACPEGRWATVWSERKVAAEKRPRYLLPVLPVSRRTGTPVLQALLLSRCTCRRVGAGRGPRSRCWDTSWQAKISCCCSAQTSDERGSVCRARVSLARGTSV